MLKNMSSILRVRKIISFYDMYNSFPEFLEALEGVGHYIIKMNQYRALLAFKTTIYFIVSSWIVEKRYQIYAQRCMQHFSNS